MNNLKNDVLEILQSYVDDDYSLNDIIDDVLIHGCQSWALYDMVYYDNTTKFYQRNKDEINALVYKFDDELGTNILNDFKEFDKLAWFAFELTAREIGLERGLEL